MPAALAMRSRLGWQLVSSYYTSVSLVQTDSRARAARNLDFLVACLSSAILMQAVNVNYPLQSLRNQTCDHFPTSPVYAETPRETGLHNAITLCRLALQTLRLQPSQRLNVYVLHAACTLTRRHWGLPLGVHPVIRIEAIE